MKFHTDDAEPFDFETVMAEYLERIDAGESPDPAQYIQQYPQFADDLRTFFRNHHWLGGPSSVDLADSWGESLIGQTIGTYSIESEIARGGMGVVYRAHQAGLGRPVALKLISSGVLASREERRRFRIEAEAAAKLQHPGIVAIHEIGSWQGYEYFSMALVEGPTLQQAINNTPYTVDQSVRLMIDIARAVGFAHRAGILHRDLKPDNILLSENGQPLLTDFGLAKWHQDGTLLTRTGQVLGTPHYMSPEQASGRAQITTQSDVYSLGAILYALFTGQPPHAGASAAEVLRSVLQDEPTPPRSLAKELPASLENICLKAISKDATDRYATADAMADDLQDFLDGNPVAADESGVFGQVARELRRDQHQSFFVNWSRSLAIIGGIIFVAHCAIFSLNAWNFPRSISFWIPRVAMFTAIALVIYRAKGGRLTPRTVAERPVYSIWLGYMGSLFAINVLTLTNVIPISSVFPLTSTLSGFGFLAMSGHVWGASAILGAAFLIVGMVMPMMGNAAPLVFGAQWFLSLSLLANHYRHRHST
ncbi:serine/threonine protein kinase [Rubripirellula amarantea]|nr:serine/threonine protein kinase [Rubripirellula amarantea]